MVRRFLSKRRVALLAIAVALLFLYLYRPPITGGVSVQSVEAGLRTLGYEHCGTYTLGPRDGVVTFSKVFEGEVRCFIIVKRPGEDYMFKEPRATLVIEPPLGKTVYRYSVGARFFYLLQRLAIDESIKPFSHWGAGVLNRTMEPPPPNDAKAANDDLYIAFSYKPEKDGFPVKITLTVRADVIEGRAPPPPSLLETGIRSLARVLDMVLSGELADRAMQLPPDQRKLAAQLGIKDIKVFMSYLGYELCGEFTAKDTDEIQKVELEVEIDLNEGKACYILIHPPPGKKAFLIISSYHEAKLVGDEEQRREYLMRSSSMETEGRYFLGTFFRLRSGYEALGLGRGSMPDDVERPYASRIGLGKVSGEGPEFGSNASILIYFAYKGDPEVIKTFNEQLQLRLETYTIVEFRIIPANYVVLVD
jgi:hypothetical protein